MDEATARTLIYTAGTVASLIAAVVWRSRRSDAKTHAEAVKTREAIERSNVNDQLFQHFERPSWILDPVTFRVLKVNAATSARLKLTPSDAVGRHYGHLFPEQTADQLGMLARRVVGDEARFDAWVMMPRSCSVNDRHEEPSKWFVRCYPLTNTEGAVTGLFVSAKPPEDFETSNYRGDIDVGVGF